MEVNGRLNALQNIFFCLPQKKEWWQNFHFLCRTSNLKPSGIYRFVLFFVLVWVMRIVSAFNYCKEMFLRNMSLWPKGLCVQSWCRAAATCSVCLFALGLSDSTVSAVVWCRMGRLLIITPELLHKLLTVRKTHFVMIHMSATWAESPAHFTRIWNPSITKPYTCLVSF